MGRVAFSLLLLVITGGSVGKRKRMTREGATRTGRHPCPPRHALLLWASWLLWLWPGCSFLICSTPCWAPAAGPSLSPVLHHKLAVPTPVLLLVVLSSSCPLLLLLTSSPISHPRRQSSVGSRSPAFRYPLSVAADHSTAGASS